MGRRLAPFVLVLVALAPARAPAAAALPNLVPLAPTDIKVRESDPGTEVPEALRFSTSTANEGTVALDLLGAPPRDETRTAAQQCVAWTGRVCEGRADVGDFAFHAEHGHWHLDDYATYELRSLLPDGTPDFTIDGLVRSSGKVSFCLLDYERRRPQRPIQEDPFDRSGFYVGCTGLLQGISAGWADTYEERLEGQQVVTAGVPDGTYALVITVNPSHRLLETSYEDNVAWQTVAVSQNGGVVVPLY